jgi:hypothetical protein
MDPHALTWEHENAEPPASNTPRYAKIATLGELPALLHVQR